MGNDVLRAHGILCGMVIKCSNIASASSEGFAIAKDWEPPEALGTNYPPGGDLLDAFLSVTVNGNLAPRFPSYASVLEIKDAYLHGIKESADEASSQKTNTYFNRAKKFADGRKILYTEGGYIGLGCFTSRVGDQIYAIIGCSNLVILRPATNGQLNVVGTCNMHGFMDFKAVLRPLPDGWHVEEDGPGRRIEGMRFINSRTGTKSIDNPRLPRSLPNGWKSKMGPDRNRYFIEEGTGKTCWENPRLSDVAFLRSRGVDIHDILLI